LTKGAYLFNQNVLLLSVTLTNCGVPFLVKHVKKEVMAHVAVYFTKSEIRDIKKKASKKLLGMSPYLRQFYVKEMKLTT